jgi:hypothetical protein
LIAKQRYGSVGVTSVESFSSLGGSTSPLPLLPLPVGFCSVLFSSVSSGSSHTTKAERKHKIKDRNKSFFISVSVCL